MYFNFSKIKRVWTVNGNKYIKIFYADLGSIKEDRAEKISG
jgi:hypothetical protein